MRLTTKKIIEAATLKTGVKKEYVELVRFTTGYYWAGKAGAAFIGAEAFYRLSDVTLERWVEDFEDRVQEVMEGHRMSEYPSFNAYIESLDWTIEFE
jgi:hypothetical protein